MVALISLPTYHVLVGIIFAVGMLRTTVGKRSDACGNESTSPAEPSAYSAVVAFGASDVDNGHPRPSYYNNTLRGSPYWEGRFTNGYVFVEYLAQGILAGKNITLFDYAYGDATIWNKLVNVAAPDTATQTHSYIHDVKHNLIQRHGASSSGRVLHIFWIGTNDVIQIWKDVITNNTFSELTLLDTIPHIADRPEKEFGIARERIDAAVSALIKQVAGVRYDTSVNRVLSDILILTLPPLETIPNLFYQSRELVLKNDSLYMDETSLAKTYQRYVGELTARFNRGIIDGIQDLKQDVFQENLTTSVLETSGKPTFVKVFDTVGFWNYVHENPSQFGFENVVDACWNSTTGGICKDPDRWEYWDTLHVSTAMHRFLAQKISAVSIFNS